MAPIKVGDMLPSVDLFEHSPANKINTCDLTTNKRVIIFAVLGAYRPECSKTHLAGFISSADSLKCEQNVDEIVCVSVNNPYVMSHWGENYKAGGKVRMLADPYGDFVKALDLTLPSPGFLRGKRFSMIVENGKVKVLNVEPDGTGLSCSVI